MKNKILLVLVVSTLTVGCNAPSTNSLSRADHEYEIDTWGSNSEVYEFTPKSNKNKSCVFLMLDNGLAMGLQCFDKPTAQELHSTKSINEGVPG